MTPDFAFWYMPAYVTYTKTLAHAHGHLQQFYRNCGTLNFPHKIEKFELKVLGFVILGARFCFAFTGVPCVWS